MKKMIYSLLAGSILLAAAYSCSKSDGYNSGNNGGSKGGSMARFAITGDYLYTVDHSTLKTVRLTDPQHPEFLDLRNMLLSFDIETIFPYQNKLFIGSRSAMYIYDIENPEFPEEISRTSHFTSCDPVVAAGNYAYVTLNTDRLTCPGGTNELKVYDISDLKNPLEVSTNRNLQSPQGLSVDEAAARLFVCDQGVKGFDLSDPANPKLDWDLTDIKEAKGMEGYDCITMDGLLLVIGKDGLYQFDYTGETVKFVSKIDLRK